MKQNKNLYISLVLIIVAFLVYIAISPIKVASEGKTAQPEAIKQVISVQDYAKQRVEAVFGINHWASFYFIISEESGWCHTKWNGQNDCPEKARMVKLEGRSNAQGLCQTMLSKHGLLTDYDYMNDPYRQIDWCINYAKERYVNPNNAWKVWKEKKWW